MVSVAFLVVAQVAALADLPRRVEVVLGLQGFVLSAVFGKAYSLLPSYFDRSLSWPVAPAVHLPLQVAGVAGLAADATGAVPASVGAAGAVLWAAGVVVLVATMLATVRGNLTGAETGTGESERERLSTDRFANVFVPVALAYLLVGSWELLAGYVGWPTLLAGVYPRIAHLLAAGVALLLLFAVGFRLLPRFLATRVSEPLARVVLPAGAAGPALLAWGHPAGGTFQLGALLEAVAVVGFAAAYIGIFVGSDRDRVGFYGPLLGVCFGVLGVGLGLSFAVGGFGPALVASHLRVNLFGLLGLSVVGVIYQFYPPAVGRWPATSDRTALATLAVLAGGLALAALGPHLARSVGAAGHALVAAGGCGVLYLLVAAMRRQTSR